MLQWCIGPCPLKVHPDSHPLFPSEFPCPIPSSRAAAHERGVTPCRSGTSTLAPTSMRKRATEEWPCWTSAAPEATSGTNKEQGREQQQKHHQQSRHVGHICHGASGRTKRNLFGAKKYVCADLWSPCLRISMSETWCEISLQTAVVSSKSDLNMRKRTLCPTTHPTAHFTFPPFGSSLASSSHYVQGTAHHNGLRPCRSVLSLGPSRSGPARGVPHADPSSTT